MIGYLSKLLNFSVLLYVLRTVKKVYCIYINSDSTTVTITNDGLDKSTRLEGNQSRYDGTKTTRKATNDKSVRGKIDNNKGEPYY